MVSNNADAARPIPGLLSARGGARPWCVRRQAMLGAGRAAQVWLVCAETVDGQNLLCAEKVFQPGWLARAVYRLSFQAPFAYAASEDAILAAYYRRRVAAELTIAMVPNAAVARPLYARWLDEEQTFALAAEYIRGRGIIPQAADPHCVRRVVSHYFGRGEVNNRRSETTDEITNWLAVMKGLERLFQASGLVGAGWQVCPQALVSTANLLRAGDRYVVVDLESGVPAALVPRYLAHGWRLGTGLLFDDIDPSRLERWLAEHRQQLIDQRGADGYDAVCGDADRLIHHTQRWKKGELALARHKHRFLSRQVRRQCRAACVARWARSNLLDAQTLRRMRRGSQRVFFAMFFAAAVPGVAGRCLKMLIGNRSVRRDAARMVYDGQFRHRQLERLVQEKVRQWHRAGRLRTGQTWHWPLARFWMHLVLSVALPARMHRWISDPMVRRKSVARLGKICFCSQFQRRCGRLVIRSSIARWLKAERLQPAEAALLQRQLAGNDTQEYVKAFALHVGLKLLAPVVVALKVGGVSLFFLSANPLALLPWSIMPIGRTLITLGLMCKDRHASRRYTEALIVGLFPTIGNFAYPIQMYFRHPHLAAFLLRDGAARFGQWLPVYGGRNSRTELWAIKSTNLILEALDIVAVLMGVARGRRWPARVPHGQTLHGVLGERLHRETFSSEVDQVAQAQVIPFARARPHQLPNSNQADESSSAEGGRDAA